MPDYEQNLLEAVIHITEERDKKSLIKVLVEVLSDLIDHDAIVLFLLPRGANDQYLEAAASSPMDAWKYKGKLIPSEYGYQRVAIDDSSSQCISSGKIISVSENDANRMLFTIVVNNNVTGILDIDGHLHTKNTVKLIQSFVRIYSNFLAIIDDNEHDTLTGLLNRRTFDAQLSELLSHKDKQPLPLSANERRKETTDAHYWVGILDIDHFKSINDNFGHVYGDEVLLLFADLMRESFRSSDLLFRYGGEEFVVVLTPVAEPDAVMVFERFRKKLESFDFPQVGKVTVSIGMVRVDIQEHTTTLLEHADQSLYFAKEHGRNQVCNYHALLKAGLLEERKIENDIELF